MKNSFTLSSKNLTTETQRHRENQMFLNLFFFKLNRIFKIENTYLVNVLTFIFSVPLCLCGKKVLMANYA